MCPPALGAAAMFYTSLAISAVTGVVQYVGQQQQADAQYDAQVQNQQATRDAAISDMLRQSDDLAARQQQETSATALNVNNSRLAAMRAAATANASSEAAGVSVDMLMSDFDRQYLSYADSQFQQLGFTEDQIQRSREGIEAQALSRINSVPMTPVVYPGLGGALLGIGAQGLQSYQTFSTRDPISGNYTL